MKRTINYFLDIKQLHLHLKISLFQSLLILENFRIKLYYRLKILKEKEFPL